MRCERCDFENIPGQTRCVRCGSILEADGHPIDVHPPRMPAWQKPFRDTVRRLRRCRVMPEKSPITWLGTGLGSVLSSTAAGLLLNVIPGLGYLLQGRFRSVCLLVLLWLILLSAGLFLYGGPVAIFLIGLAIGVHAWIAVQEDVFKRIPQLIERVGLVLLVVVGLVILYVTIARTFDIGIVGARTLLAVPALNVREGDYLLVHRLDETRAPFQRGTLVWVVLHQRLARGPRGRASPPTIGQVVGLPGESIAIRNKIYFVGDRPLDPNRFPVPAWLQRYPLKAPLHIPEEAHFVSSVYQVTFRGARLLTDQMIADVCIIKTTDIRGQAFMRWLPLHHRGFIEYDE